MAKAGSVTVVMVDDNADEIFLARRQLRSQGIVNPFVSEQNSERIIDTLTRLKVEGCGERILIFLDISMPKMDGFETLELIRKDRQFSSLPVIMFSASDDDADIEEAIRRGADGYLVKPICIDSLMSVLGSLPKLKWNNFLGGLGSKPPMKYEIMVA